MSNVTPTGNPAWLRSIGFEDYGGSESKVNYQNQGVVNPRTDVGAEGFARACSDQAAVTRTVGFTVLTVTCNDTSPAAPTVHAVNMMTGVSATYAGGSPPAGFPTLARVSAGKFTVTFAATYDDAYGIEGAFGITHALAAGHGASSNTPTVSYTAGGVVLTVSCFAAAGTALSDAKCTVEVW